MTGIRTLVWLLPIRKTGQLPGNPVYEVLELVSCNSAEECLSSSSLGSGKTPFHSGRVEVNPVFHNCASFDTKDIHALECHGRLISLASGFESEG